MLNFPVYQRSQILFDSEEVALDHFPKGRDQLAGGRDRKVRVHELHSCGQVSNSHNCRA